ncbi:energy-coupled thiamine transporter ThiT [Sporosarcina sp. E16_3]|uniref:energy-coupled thiamine transporter ThiT n=1 Tax=Sporosarcina sp. E16_3 TaxID=2789293 RepID=UPI001A90DC9C|nr:energy-coupled thiamine transporter ThiT [Sporosarcina sp. E16_3]MBO0601682.1 energy-coupled thiamine transporter ThiT [Sporosarcina sp. E16_3]
MDRKRLQLLLEIAILGAISFVLDKIGFSMPQGGSVTLSMLPIVVMAFRWGIVGGMLTGLVSGLLQLMMGGYVLNVIQAALDYFVAYALVGVAGVTLAWLLSGKVKGDKGSMVVAIVVGTVIGGLLRFVIHFIGGIVFFASYAPVGQPVWLYSLVYNASYMIPAIILSAIVASILFTTAPRLLERK